VSIRAVNNSKLLLHHGWLTEHDNNIVRWGTTRANRSINRYKVNCTQQAVVLLIQYINMQFHSIPLGYLSSDELDEQRIWLTCTTLRHVHRFVWWIHITTMSRCRRRYIRTEIEYERTVLYCACRIKLKRQFVISHLMFVHDHYCILSTIQFESSLLLYPPVTSTYFY